MNFLTKVIYMTDNSNENIVTAINKSLENELNRDEDVVLLGEDIGENGGVFRATQGLKEEFGENRVIDTPLSESGIVGTSVGLAIRGMRPVAEIQFMGFVYPGFDQIISHVSRYRSRSRGRFTCPIVIRMPYGAGIEAPESHSESTEALFTHIPGLKVVVPSNPYDARGLLSESIRCNDPVIFLEPKRIYRSINADIPSKDYTVDIGSATVKNSGDDITVVTWGSMVPRVMKATKELDSEVEVIDLRTLKPLDIDTIVESIKKTMRCVVVHEAPKTSGFGAEIVSKIQEEAFLYQEAPINRVTGPDTMPPLRMLEEEYLVDKEQIKREIKKTLNF